MPLNINFNRTNDMIKMLSNLMLEKKMGDLTKQRQFDVMAEQDRLMRERAAKEDVASRSMEQYKSAINIKESLEKFTQDVSKLDPITRLTTLEQYEPDPQKKSTYTEQKNQAYKDLAPLWVEVTKGIPLTEESWMLAQKWIAPDKMQSFVNELGQNIRLEKTLPIQKMTAQTGARNATIAEKNLAAEQGGGGKAGKEYIDRWTKPISDAINFLEPVARGDNVMSQMYQEPAGYMSSKLSEIQIRLNNGEPLTKEDQNTINQARDLKNLVNKYTNQRLVGQERGPGSATDIAETQQVETDLNKARAERVAAPLVQGPITEPQVPTISGVDLPPGTYTEVNPQTGERKAYINGQWIRIR